MMQISKRIKRYPVSSVLFLVPSYSVLPHRLLSYNHIFVGYPSRYILYDMCMYAVDFLIQWVAHTLFCASLLPFNHHLRDHSAQVHKKPPTSVSPVASPHSFIVPIAGYFSDFSSFPFTRMLQ